MWENLVGRSRPFWQRYFPLLQETFPGALDDVTAEEFTRAVNRVQPSLIRVEADEVTYNLHILLRFELENDLLESRVAVDYEAVSAEDLAARSPAAYDIVTCMELLEHVPDPASTVRACALLARPGGQVFFSTINRNLKSYLFAVIGAEYVLKLLPRGTHDYARFVRPSELARHCRDSGLAVRGIVGMTYNPFSRSYALGSDTDVNYLVHCAREA